MWPANWLEPAIVLEGRRNWSAREQFDTFLHEQVVTLVPLTEEHAREARSAWLRFGRGRHQAALNYGDTMAYATARVAGEPCSSRATTSRKPISSRP